MPEGDTIFRTAVHLRAALVGQRIEEVGCGDRKLATGDLRGQVVEAVEARGKHLLIHTDSNVVIHSHMGMTGSWHVYQPGEGWRKPAGHAAIVLRTASAVCVCFYPKTLEQLSPTQLRSHALLGRLGPDILADRGSDQPILERFRVHHPTPIGQAVMNQTIVCGIGNVYKSETLFLTRTHPWILVRQLPDERILEIIHNARRLMLANLGGYPRRTRTGRDGARLWVYRRTGQRCFVCGQTIQVGRQGDLGRTTYWCPECQPYPTDAEFVLGLKTVSST
jgi:endonuclease-8